jgi:hypothetical protein
MMSQEAPTKRNLRRPAPETFSDDEAQTRPAPRTAAAPPKGRPEFDFSRDPRHDPEE